MSFRGEHKTYFHSIKTKLSGVLLLVLAFMLAMNVFVFSQINDAVQRIDSVFSSNVTIGKLSDHLELLQDTVYEYLTTRSTPDLENYYRYEQDYRALLEQLNDKNTDSEIKMLEKNIRKMSESYLEQTSRTVQAKRGRNVERYREAYTDETRTYEYINAYIYKLNNLQFQLNSGNYQLLLNSMNVLEKLSFIIMSIVFVTAFLISVLFINDLIKPLTALSAAAHEVAEGNLSVEKLPVVAEDEIGTVTRGFNHMVESIRQYIERMKESMEKEARHKEQELSMEAHLKEAQLKFLQAQINPHFLFNSLNAGAQLAMLEDAERTGVFLEKMADFFRYNVRKMSDNATLQEELEAVDNYIYILNVRFAGDITFYKDVEEGYEDLSIPSMILQPLVENAVQHGIRNCMETGWIRLSVKRQGDGLKITVSDNGEGMSADMIRSVMEGNAEQSADKKYSTGIAVNNVIHRLQLYYNRENLLQISSEGPGRGTQVSILLPLTMKGEEYVSNINRR